jgi:hypothetical protein
MMAYDYEACTYFGEIYCTGCLPYGATKWEIEPIFADSEWDYFPVCAHCGEIHEYVSLTAEGERHERSN